MLPRRTVKGEGTRHWGKGKMWGYRYKKGGRWGNFKEEGDLGASDHRKEVEPNVFRGL